MNNDKKIFKNVKNTGRTYKFCLEKSLYQPIKVMRLGCRVNIKSKKFGGLCRLVSYNLPPNNLTLT